MHLFLLVLMLGVSSAELRRQGREDMEACPDQACRNAVLQQLVIKLQEAAADEKSKEKAAADDIGSLRGRICARSTVPCGQGIV